MSRESQQSLASFLKDLLILAMCCHWHWSALQERRDRTSLVGVSQHPNLITSALHQNIVLCLSIFCFEEFLEKNSVLENENQKINGSFVTDLSEIWTATLSPASTYCSTNSPRFIYFSRGQLRKFNLQNKRC